MVRQNASCADIPGRSDYQRETHHPGPAGQLQDAFRRTLRACIFYGRLED
jgi:hypothetical protein